MILYIRPARVEKMYEEIRKLDVNRFTQTLAVMTRVFFELSVDHYFSVHSLKLKKQVTGRDGVVRSHNKGFHDKLNEALTDIIAKQGLDENEFKSIKKEINDSKSPLSTELMHDFVHDKSMHAKPSDVISAWSRAQVFLEHIWAKKK